MDIRIPKNPLCITAAYFPQPETLTDARANATLVPIDFKQQWTWVDATCFGTFDDRPFGFTTSDG
ncbi:MAG: hypothetical protein AAGK26_15680 [Pseudomonadota bacterium]